MFQNSVNQTKLSQDEKIDLKRLKQAFYNDHNGYLFSFENGVTVALAPEFIHSKMLRIAYSVKSDDEIKFRRKVGEYLAICRWFDRDVANVMLVRYAMPLYGDDAKELAKNVAELITGEPAFELV